MYKQFTTLMLIGAIALTSLTGCVDSKDNKPNEPKSTIENSVNKENKGQLDIQNAQEHFEYVSKLQDEIIENLQELNSELYTIEGEPKGKYTDKAANNMKNIKSIAKEYIKYDNKLKETTEPDKLYKEAMKELEQYLVEIESDYKKGQFENDYTGIEHLTNFIDLTMQGANEFNSLGVNSENDEASQTKNKVEENSENKTSSEQEVYGPPKPANLEKK